MSVLDQRYRRWEGRAEPHWRRIAVIPRFALMDVYSRKWIVILSVIALLPSLGLAAAVYVAANAAQLRQMGIQLLGDLDVGPIVFESIFSLHVTAAIVLLLLAAPRLFAPDLAGGALPLYFSKSLTRADYLLGKGSVLFVMMSCATWVPLLVPAALRALLAEPGERLASTPLAGGIALAGIAFALVMTLIASAVAVQVQRAALVPFALLGLLVATSWGAEIAIPLTGSSLPAIASPLHLLAALRDHAMRIDVPSSMTFAQEPLAVGWAAAGLAAWSVISLIILVRKVRPVEVIR